MLTFRLKNNGFFVLTVNQGAEALTSVLIYPDEMLTGIDGFQALGKLSKMDEISLTPRTTATTLKHTSTLLKAIKIGVINLFANPFGVVMITRKLKSDLQKPA